jgi:hypothetical protein
MKRLIVEGIPSQDDHFILKSDLQSSVMADCKSLSLVFSEEEFTTTLRQLHDEQFVFVFRNGFVGLTGIGKFNLNNT